MDARGSWRLAWFLTVSACAMPTCAAGRHAPEAAATEGASTTRGAAEAPKAGSAHCGVEGKWCTVDVSTPDTAFAPAETLSLPRALWGIDAPNLLKSITVGWDAVGGRLYAIGNATDRLVVIAPAVGHPTGTIDLDFQSHKTGLLRIDEARRRLYRVDRGDGSIRAVDLDRGELVARTQPERSQPGGQRERQQYPVHDAVVDPATGWLWVANLEGSLTGYSPDLSQRKVATGITAPSNLDIGPTKDEIVVLDVPSRDAMQLVRYRPSTDTILSSTPIPRQAGPTSVSVAPDGSIVLGGRTLAVLGPDDRPRWTHPLYAVPESVAFVGDTVGVLMGDPAEHAGRAAGERASRPGGPGGGQGGPGGPHGRGAGGGGQGDRPPRADRPSVADAPDAPEGPERHLLLFDLATGAPKGDVTVGFEARSLSPDPTNHRFFVGNGGDASVAVVDVPTATGVATYDVGSAAEHVTVDPVTGDRYVLDRLGGSTLYRWPKGATTVVASPAGKWPSDLAIDPKRRRLFALGHFDATLLAWDLDSHAALPSVPLGVPANHTDTLGDLDYDDAVGLAAAIFPETGSLVVVDPARGPLWSHTDDALRAGPNAGPGNGFVAVDGARDRVYVVTDHGAKLRSYALKSGQEVGSLDLPVDNARGSGAYQVDVAWLDRARGRLYVADAIVDVAKLAVAGRLDGAGKVFWADDRTILAVATDSPREPERLLEYDARTGALRTSRPLVRTGMMRLAPTYDPAGKRVYAADMAEARVLAWDWPK